jgi:hypothetical protein
MGCASSNAPSSGGSGPWATVSRERPAEEDVLAPAARPLGPLSTERRRRVLGTSPIADSLNFAFTEFSEGGQEFIGNSSPSASVVALINLRRE